MSSGDIYTNKIVKKIIRMVKERKVEAEERNKEGTAYLNIQNNNKYLTVFNRR